MKTDSENDYDNKPWYRQFWLWVVLTPLILVVCVMSVLVTIAVLYSDDVVIDNYYKEGRMINQAMEQDQRAQALKLFADIRFDRTTGEVFARMPETAHLPVELLLLLDHPFEADFDQQVLLRQVSAGNYRGELSSEVKHSWYLMLLPELIPANRKSAEWSLSGEINFEITDVTVLRPRVQSKSD